MEVDRLDRVAADEVDAVEHVRELQELVEPDSVAGAADPVEVDDVGRAADGAEGHPRAADLEVLLGVPAVQGELCGRGGDSFDDHLPGKSNVLPGLVDLGTGLAQEAARLAIPEVHADPFEDRQRGIVNRFQFVGRDDLGVVQPHPLLPKRTL